MSKAASWAAFALSAALLVALDLLLKGWAYANLIGQPGRVLVPGVLGLTYLENPGAAFGLLAGFRHSPVLLAALSSLLMAAVVWYYHVLPGERRFLPVRAALILIFAGGVGNNVDRISRGAVRDMLEILFVRFPIFNLADVYVTLGTCAFVFLTMFVVKDAPYLKE